jgi:hypothetical protein
MDSQNIGVIELLFVLHPLLFLESSVGFIVMRDDDSNRSYVVMQYFAPR